MLLNPLLSRFQLATNTCMAKDSAQRALNSQIKASILKNKLLNPPKSTTK